MSWKKLNKELNKERSEGWLEDIKVVLNATTVSPIYIPTVWEEWIKAVNQKSPPASEDPEDPPKQPKKSTDPKPIRKHVAKKSSTGQQKSGTKKDDSKDNSQSQAEDPGKQPGDPTDELIHHLQVKTLKDPNHQEMILKVL